MGRPVHLISFLVAALAAAVAAGCAEGSTIENAAGSGGSRPSGAGGGDGGASGSGGDDGPATSSSRSSASAGPSTSSSTTGSSSSGGDGGAGDGGGEGTTSTAATTSSSSGGTLCNFTSPNDCAGAEDLGAIAGDEDAPPVMVQGTTSKWFTIWVEERSSGISETDLSYRITLSSPAGMNYDLIVHPGPQDGDVDCNAAPLQGQSNGAAEEVSQSWDDDQGLGGEDDSVHLSIEVRHLSGEDCAPLDAWTLTIEGYI